MATINVSFEFEYGDPGFGKLLFGLSKVRRRLWALNRVNSYNHYYGRILLVWNGVRKRLIEREIGFYIKNNMDYDQLF